jgi:hypothetical protein
MLPAGIGLLLVIGFAYSAVATGREYRAVLAGSTTKSRTASVDTYFEPVKLTSSEQLRKAIRSAGWEGSREISLVVDMSSFTVSERDQLLLATSYLLYPTRIVLRSAEETALVRSRGEAPRMILAGAAIPSRVSVVRQVSPRLWLAAFR